MSDVFVLTRSFKLVSGDYVTINLRALGDEKLAREALATTKDEFQPILGGQVLVDGPRGPAPGPMVGAVLKQLGIENLYHGIVKMRIHDANLVTPVLIQ